MKLMQIVTLAQLGGAQEVLAQLVEQALKEKHTVILISQHNGPLWERLPKNPYLKRYKLKSLVQPIHPFKDLLSVFLLWYIALKERPQIIHLHSAKVGFLGRLAFFPWRKRVLYTQHGFDSIVKAHPKMLKLEKLCDSLSYTQIAVSQYDKKLLSSVKIHGGIHGTIVIHNACPALKITQEQLIYQKLFEQLKKSGKKIILSISRFNTTQNSQGIYCQSKQQKNFPLTLEVAKSLGEDYQFIWIGNTGIAPQSLPKNIMLLGSLANAKAYLPLADLFLLLSHYEGLPISILESLSVGIPVLASAVGGVEELIKEGETGFLDYSHKADLISQKIKKLFASPQKLKQVGENGKKSWQKCFTSQKMYEKYKQVWQEMLSNKK